MPPQPSAPRQIPGIPSVAPLNPESKPFRLNQAVTLESGIPCTHDATLRRGHRNAARVAFVQQRGFRQSRRPTFFRHGNGIPLPVWRRA